MLSKKEKERYSRHILLAEIGEEGQEKLKQARVLVTGCGGLGCPVLQYLVAAGVGNIGIIDHDSVDFTNLQRQVLFDESVIGMPKVEAAISKLSVQNSSCNFKGYPYQLDRNNAIELISTYDLIIDCTDNFQTRYLINDTCVFLNKPLIYGAIHRFEGQVSVFNHNNGPTYRCLFPEAPPTGSVANCSETGVIGVLPGIIGTMQAMEALKVILGIGTTLSGRIMVYNGLTGSTSTFGLSRTDHRIYTEMINTGNLPEYEKLNCESTGEESRRDGVPIDVDVEQFREMLGSSLLIVDVREEDETPKLDYPNVMNIPLSALESSMEKLDGHTDLVLFCRSGVRSKMAAKIIMNQTAIKGVRHLKGGIRALIPES